MKCPDCSTTMIEESYSGVTVDKCPQCHGLWFDMEEISEYASHKNPSASFIPTDDYFTKHTNGVKDLCPCCEENALELGSLSDYSFKKCTWCGGISIKRDTLRRLLKSASSNDNYAGVGEAALGLLEILEIVAEVIWS